MNDRRSWLFALLRSLTDLRLSDDPHGLDSIIWGPVYSLISRGLREGYISPSEKVRLTFLAMNAGLNSGFFHLPDPRNAGPYMPDSVWYERAKAEGKLQAVPVNEPVQLQPVAAPRKLFLLCLLGKSPASKIIRTFAQPVGVSRLPAPWIAPSARWCVRLSRRSAKRSAVSGIWPIQNSPGLVLREAHAVAPSAEVLARLQRHRQTNAIRTAARTIQFGVPA